jgi:replicative DNA helicase
MASKQEIIIGICIADDKYVSKILKCDLGAFGKYSELAFILMERYKEGKKSDLIILSEALKDKYQPSDLAKLVDHCVNTSNIDFYITGIKEDWKKHQLSQLTDRMEIDKMDWQDVKTEINKITYDEYVVTNNILGIKDLINEFWSKPDCQYYRSLFVWIDKNLKGWFKGARYIVIGARPKIGKTTFFLNIAHRLILQNISVGFFSSEMYHSDVFDKMVSNEVGINTNDLTNKKGLSEKQVDFITKKLEGLYDKNFYLDDTKCIDIDLLENKMDAMIKKNKVQIIGVDYIQILGCLRHERKTQREQINYISRKFKELSGKYNIPIFVLSQVNRDADGKAPRLSDLKESGAIEQDADMVIFLNPESQPDQMNCPEKWYYEIDIAANRFGAAGKFKLEFQKDISRFADFYY